MSFKDYSIYLEESKIPVRLSCVTESGWPLGLSLWFLYKDGAIYCATPKKAKVVSYLLHEPRCAIEIASDQPPYCGIRAQSKAEILEKEGTQILKALLHKYLGGTTSPLAKKLLSRKAEEVAIKITPNKIFSWNFTDRMKSSVAEPSGHLCPSQ